MKSLNKYILSAALSLVGGAAMAQTTIGYTNGTCNRTKTFRVGNSTTQGMAFYLDAEKAQQLKGATLQSFITHVGTNQTTDASFFITKELGGTALYSQAFTPGSALKANEFKATSAYVLDGEPCYIGWVMNTPTSYPTLSFDLSCDFAEGTCWAYKDNGWADVSAAGYGAPNVQIVVTGVDAFADMVAKPLQPEGYQQAGVAQVFNGQVFNYGSETVTSFDITCRLGNAEPIVYSIKDVALKSGATYDYTLPEYLTSESGILDLEVTVSNVNGAGDIDATDNTAYTSTYLYPEEVEKKILLEVFTGQACGNCPAGHTALANAMKGIEDEFIEVAHHSGYYPDAFSMAEDWEYTWLYGTSGTYAPGATVNRTIVPAISTESVVFASNTQSYSNAAIQALRGNQPYVGIKMYNEFDEQTRKGSVVVDVTTYVVPSDSMHTLNVWLVQDGLVSMQSGAGSNYVHNHVFRGALTNSAWGLLIPLTEGETVRRSFAYEIPEAIRASYYADTINYYFDAIPADMQLVAFVSDFSSSNPQACNVHNAAKVAVLTNNMADGIGREELAATPSVVTVAGRTVSLPAGCAGAEVYSITGALMHQAAAGESSFTLPKGLYLIRVRMADGSVEGCKVAIGG